MPHLFEILFYSLSGLIALSLILIRETDEAREKRQVKTSTKISGRGDFNQFKAENCYAYASHKGESNSDLEMMATESTATQTNSSKLKSFDTFGEDSQDL